MDIPVDIAIASMRFEETYEVEFDALYERSTPHRVSLH
jgi:hypothetical protein